MQQNGRSYVTARTYDNVTAIYRGKTQRHLRIIDNLGREVLGLANAHLLGDTYAEKLLIALDDPAAERALYYCSHNPKLDLSANLIPTVKAILDSDLSADAKFTYFVSAITLRFELSEAELSQVFKVRPDPLGEWERSGITIAQEAKRISILKFALMVNYQEFSIHKRTDRSANFYRGLNLSLAFAYGNESGTYGEFIEKQGDDFFVPTVNPVAHAADCTLYNAVPQKLLSDLSSADFVRFMRYFAQNTPHVLLPWAKERLSSGVVPFHEIREKNAPLHAPLEPLDSRWVSVIGYLSAEEIPEFQALLREHNGVSSIARGASNELGAFLAYAFVRGGATRFRELVRHIVNNLPQSNEPQHFVQATLSKKWKNPYANSAGGNPSLKPYVSAFENDNDPSVPFELLLMIQ